MIEAIQMTANSAEAFRAVLIESGLTPGEVVPDGKLRRCPTIEKPRSENGWHVLHTDPPAGAFGDWGTGLSETWSMTSEPLPPAERQRLREAIEEQKVEREAKQVEEQRAAIKKARQYLEGLTPATAENPYLKRKGVKPCPGLLAADGPDLILPVLSPADNKPMSYQKIAPDGSKKFAPGAPMAGGFFVVKGDKGPLLLAEGLATALSLHVAKGATVLVAFSAGNLGTVAEMARKRYPERRIIVCADNDTETAAKIGKNPGVEAATAAALTVNGLVASPPDGGDWNDTHHAQGIEAVKAGIEAAMTPESEPGPATAADSWPEPLPLTPDEKPEPYPVDALPCVIGEAVGEVTAFVQCPVALTACSALAAISTVAAGLVDVRRADKLAGPTGLFFLGVADSGERKSTVDGFFTKQIRTWEVEQEELYKPEMQTWRAADDAWKAERDGLITAIREAKKKGRDTGKDKNELIEHEARKPEPPKVPRLLVGDATSEALTWRLAALWPVSGLLSSEAGVIFGGHAMGRDSIMRNLATMNSLWDGQSLSVDRRTSESYTVRSARLTLGLAVQPETIRQFIDGTKGLARGSGFLARFLVAWPESTQGRRPFHEATEHWPALSRYHRRLADLLDQPIRLDGFGQLSPVVLDLATDAKAVWVKLHDDIESELAPNGDLAEARDVASKAGDNAARLAALFHCFEHGPAGTIGPDHIHQAARIVVWHLFEARRFLNQLATPEAVGDALSLESWLVDHCRRERAAVVTRNHVQKFGPNRTRRKAALDAALIELEGVGRIRRIEGRKVLIAMNPGILGGSYGPA